MKCEGVFEHLVDKAAFVDRIDLSVWGNRRLRPKLPVQVLRNLPIGGPGRFYARSIHAECILGGNPAELRYGRLSLFSSVPPIRLILRSNKTPLTAAQVMSVLDCLLRRNFSVYISSLELTADIFSKDLENIRRQITPGKRHIREFIDNGARRTLYLGLPTSCWQLRVYQKTDDVVRVEFVLRLAFLRSNAIDQAIDVLKVSKLELWKKILPPCAERRLLRSMHRRLIW